MISRVNFSKKIGEMKVYPRILTCFAPIDARRIVPPMIGASIPIFQSIEYYFISLSPSSLSYCVSIRLPSFHLLHQLHRPPHLRLARPIFLLPRFDVKQRRRFSMWKQKWARVQENGTFNWQIRLYRRSSVPAAEFMNVQFRRGFWAESCEF